MQISFFYQYHLAISYLNFRLHSRMIEYKIEFGMLLVDREMLSLSNQGHNGSITHFYIKCQPTSGIEPKSSVYEARAVQLLQLNGTFLMI